MGVREHVSRSQVGQSHFVQFFDSDETRRQAVASFLSEGYRRGAPLLVIARATQSPAILEPLEEAVGPIHRDMDSGRILVLDAADTLSRISRSGSPDPRLFENVLGTRVARASRQGRIYAYSEMVDILVQRRDFDDAILLERLWNGLLARIDLSLMCGYAAAHFVSDAAQGPLREICTAHSSVRVEAQDPLAAWLLQQAQ